MKRLLFLLCALCGCAAAPAVLAQCPDGTPPPCAAARVRPAAPQHGSIAVLPFANRSPDTADAYLADEFPEQITGRLSRIPQLHVTSATAVAAQWRRTPDALASARALRVEWLVTGTLRRAQSQISASVELVRAGSGEQAWSALMRRGDGDIGAIEAMVAESVAVAAAGRLAPGQRAAIVRQDSRNPEAYRLYLFAKAVVARRTAEDIAAAGHALEQAVRIDPRFAGAWARLSIVRSLQTQYGWYGPEALPDDSLMVRSRAAADRALALDSGSAEAWLASGQWYSLDGELGAAWAALHRAEQLDSLDGNIEHGIGYLYSVDLLDLPEQAEPYFRRALELDPELRNDWRHLGLSSAASGRVAEGLAYMDSSLARGGFLLGYYDRAWMRFEHGDVAGALADQARADSLGNLADVPLQAVTASLRRAVYALASGDSTRALALLADTGQNVATVAGRAMVEMALGRRAEALVQLERLRRMPVPGEPTCAPATPCSANLYAWRLLHLALFQPLREDARFQRLLDETRPRVPWLAGGQ